MADWADEIACKLAAKCVTSAARKDLDVVAAALRQARLDALEEAGKLASSMHKKGQIGDDIASAIRALKDKQP